MLDDEIPQGLPVLDYPLNGAVSVECGLPLDPCAGVSVDVPTTGILGNDALMPLLDEHAASLDDVFTEHMPNMLEMVATHGSTDSVQPAVSGLVRHGEAYIPVRDGDDVEYMEDQGRVVSMCLAKQQRHRVLEAPRYQLTVDDNLLARCHLDTMGKSGEAAAVVEPHTAATEDTEAGQCAPHSVVLRLAHEYMAGVAGVGSRLHGHGELSVAPCNCLSRG